jgi:hypothetical protein
MRNRFQFFVVTGGPYKPLQLHFDNAAVRLFLTAHP